jgi:hypothetical protein
MAANSAITVTGLDFDTIRLNLRNFIAGKPDFTDFDFEDSAIGTLIDLLAYNTYYNAFYANMAANEAFLDTAQIYDNVVSRAKMLGYLPTSTRGPTANVRVSFTTPANSTFRTINIAKNTQFRATVNGISYTFVTPQSYPITANSSNRFNGFIQITEGVPLTHRFLFSAANTAFVLPNANTDTSSITVSVTTAGNTLTYTQASDLRTVNSTSRVFFIEPDRNKLYKISFGDNVLGKKPAFNSTVAVSYRVTNGSRANGANNFTAVSTVGGQSSFTLTTAERATGGAEIESIESIRFNAPRLYETQNRAVTREDYKRIILRDNPDLAAVNVWGGEENDPPIFGKVYACVKPKLGTLVSTNRKERIKQSIKPYNVQSIDLEIVDPTYLYVVPTLIVRYDPLLTTLQPSEIAVRVANKVIAYESTNLNRFEGKFRYSRFLDSIDSAEDSIVSSTAKIEAQKKFLPSTTQSNTYRISFNRMIYHPSDGYQTATSSTSFILNGFTSFLDDDGNGNVRAYYVSQGTRTYIKNVGTIDYKTGLITLNAFQPTSVTTDEIDIRVELDDYNVTPIRNQILLIAGAKITLINDNTGSIDARLDSVSTVGNSATLGATSISQLTTF